MNCRRVQKLIPLYVEGDLQARLADRITSHLEWCGRCNWLADEFRESQSWLRSSEAPTFDETALGDLKSTVLQRVHQVSRSSSILTSLVPHWRWRQVLALSGALLIALGVVVFYVYQARVSVNRNIPERAKDATGEEREAPSEQRMAGGAEVAPGAGLKAQHRLSRRRPSFKSRVESSTIVKNTIQGPIHAQTVRTTEKWYIAPISDSAADLRQMLRIEIQTSDPHIRIIWFAPKETDLHQSKPATD